MLDWIDAIVLSGSRPCHSRGRLYGGEKSSFILNQTDSIDKMGITSQVMGKVVQVVLICVRMLLKLLFKRHVATGISWLYSSSSTSRLASNGGGREMRLLTLRQCCGRHRSIELNRYVS